MNASPDEKMSADLVVFHQKESYALLVVFGVLVTFGIGLALWPVPLVRPNESSDHLVFTGKPNSEGMAPHYGARALGIMLIATCGTFFVMLFLGSMEGQQLKIGRDRLLIEKKGRIVVDVCYDNFDRVESSHKEMTFPSWPPHREEKHDVPFIGICFRDPAKEFIDAADNPRKLAQIRSSQFGFDLLITCDEFEGKLQEIYQTLLTRLQTFRDRE